jgi:hypothetical protein
MSYKNKYLKYPMHKFSDDKYYQKYLKYPMHKFSDDKYYQKYLKYKQKYLELKQGGGNTFITLNYYNLYESKNKEYYQNIFSIFKNKILDKDYNICSSKITEYYRNKSLYNLKDANISDRENKTINYHLLLKKISNDEEEPIVDLLGFIIVDLIGTENNEYYIDLICSKRGYGSLLLQYCINHAKKLYKEYITLDSINDNDTFNFYKRMGFHLDLPTYKINIITNGKSKEKIQFENKKYKECIELIKPYYDEINNMKLANDTFPTNYQIKIETLEENIDLNKLENKNRINIETMKKEVGVLGEKIQNKRDDIEANYSEKELKQFGLEKLNSIKAKYPVMSLIPMIRHIDNIPLNISYPDEQVKNNIRFEGLSDSELLSESIKISSK